MNNILKTKKILFLGAAPFQLPAIKKAQELGIQIIATDNVPSNIGHKLADYSENVSTTDLDGVLEIAKKYKVDGVMTYGSDVSTPAVAYVAEQLNLNGNPFQSAMLLQRKDEFRKFQKEIGLPHPDFQIIDKDFNPHKDKIQLDFPFLVKPSDSSGSKGQTKVKSMDDLANAIAIARNFCRCGVVICEKFLESDSLELDGDVLVQDGKLSFAHYGHNYFLKNGNYNVPIGEIMPGFFDENIVKQIDDQIQQIIDHFHLKTGCINFDGLIVDNQVVILDIGLRNGGNYVPDLIKMSTDVDLTEAAVYCALGITYPIKELHVKKSKPVMTHILNSRVEGYFLGVKYTPEIVNNVKKSISFVELESEVNVFSRGDYALGVAFLEFDSVEEMKEKWDKVEDWISIDVIPKDNSVQSTTTLPYKRYRELISPFIQKKLNKASEEGQKDIVRVLTNQFVFNSHEKEISDSGTTKHYDAAADFIFEGKKLFGVERLYRRQIVVEITLKCVAHCRHCLRRNYEPFYLSKDDLSRIARFIGQDEVNKDLREILITGGDPFLTPKKLAYFVNELNTYATQLDTVRIATRLPIHQPDWVNDNIISIFKQKYNFRIELATQINHSLELFPEVREAYMELRKHVSAIYNQTVLIKDVNNSAEELIELFDNLRTLDIENHYLFHCVPIGGLDWMRTGLSETLELANSITSSGLISGRVKPQVSLMTDIGKLTLYEGAIVRKEKNKILLRSNYSLEERLKWNPSWKIPASASVDEKGKLLVWYNISD